MVVSANRQNQKFDPHARWLPLFPPAVCDLHAREVTCMAGVCTAVTALSLTPRTSSLRFHNASSSDTKPAGCAFECWNGLVYRMNRNSFQSGFGMAKTGDVLTFCLDTDQGVLSMFRNDTHVGVLDDGLDGYFLRASVGLEKPGDQVALYEYTAPLEVAV